MEPNPNPPVLPVSHSSKSKDGAVPPPLPKESYVANKISQPQEPVSIRPLLKTVFLVLTVPFIGFFVLGIGGWLIGLGGGKTSSTKNTQLAQDSADALDQVAVQNLQSWLGSGSWECVDATVGLMRGAKFKFSPTTLSISGSGMKVDRSYQIVSARKSYTPGSEMSVHLKVDKDEETLLKLPSEGGLDLIALSWGNGQGTLKLMRQEKSNSVGPEGVWVRGDMKISLIGGVFITQHPLKSSFGSWKDTGGGFIRITYQDGSEAYFVYRKSDDTLEAMGSRFSRQ